MLFDWLDCQQTVRLLESEPKNQIEKSGDFFDCDNHPILDV